MVCSHPVLLSLSATDNRSIKMIHSLAFELDTEFYDIEELQSKNADGTTRYTAFSCDDRSLRDLRQKADQTVYGSGGWKCSHEHDCCGCWALLDMEVLDLSASDDSFILVEHWRQNI
jgi:hypothetical protein